MSIDESQIVCTIPKEVRVWGRVSIKLSENTNNTEIPFKTTWMISDPIEDTVILQEVDENGYCPSIFDIGAKYSSLK